MQYTIIVENDESEWNDDTGEKYHFPPRYLKFLTPGTKVIYYKGRMRDSVYAFWRLSKEPHYFGTGVIGQIQEDDNGNYYADIKDYKRFGKPVLATIDGEYLEEIPDNRLTNYWRDGVRSIDSTTYKKIVDLSN